MVRWFAVIAALIVIARAAHAQPETLRVEVLQVGEVTQADAEELDAFQSAVGASVTDFWTRFAKDFFDGVALPGCVGHVSAAGTASIKDSSSLMQTFKFGAYPLSSTAYAFDLTNVALTSKTPLPIVAQNLIEGQTVYVYDLKDRKELAQLTKTKNTYSVEDVVAAKGRIIVVTFVDANLPSGSSASTNGVTITTSTMYKCWAETAVNWWREQVQPGVLSTCNAAKAAGEPCPLFLHADDEFFLGSVTGDRFHSDEMWCPDPPASCRWSDRASYTNTVDFTFTGNGAAISGFALSWSRSSVGSKLSTLTVSDPVPRDSASAAGFQYKLTGQAVCSSVKQNVRNLLEIGCDAGSYFLVRCDGYTRTGK